MTKNKISAITIKDNEKYLRQVSKSVDIKNDKELKDDIKVLEDYCKENEVMAMAAIQLGIPKRIVYLKNTNIDIINKQQNDCSTSFEDDYNEARVLINPVILERRGLTKYWEACASCLDNCGLVLRPYKILLEYYTIDNNKHVDTFIGFESTVLSHEMDHLDGILHIDVAEKLFVLPKEERKKLRKKEGYIIIFEDGCYEKLKLKEKEDSK